MHGSLFRFLGLGLSVSITLAACGSSGSSDQPAGGAGGGAGAGAGGAGVGGQGGGSSTGPKAYGLFDIQYVKEATDAHTKIEGYMYDGSLPEMVVWDKKKTDGDCALYTPRTPFCEACNPGEICVDTNVCRAQPLTHNVGAMTVTGLTAPSGANPISLFKVAPSETAETGVTYACTESLPVPPCTAGAPVTLAATGGATYGAFSVQAQCIAPLVVTTSSMMLESGKAFALNWTAGNISGARIKVEFDLSHHGGSKGQLRCDAADTGTLQVSATLLDSLIALGVTGFPSIHVSRELTGTTPVGSGQAQLKIYSDATYTAQLAGLVSCETSSECPTGQTCLDPGKMCGIACTANTDCPTGQTCAASTKTCK